MFVEVVIVSIFLFIPIYDLLLHFYVVMYTRHVTSTMDRDYLDESKGEGWDVESGSCSVITKGGPLL